MPQNRDKLIKLFIGNISNTIIHEILEKAIDIEEIRSKDHKEIKTSLDIAKYYRDKINPIDNPLPDKNISEIKKRIINNIKNELRLRISKGYKNININIIEETVDKFLKELKIIG